MSDPTNDYRLSPPTPRPSLKKLSSTPVEQLQPAEAADAGGAETPRPQKKAATPRKPAAKQSSRSLPAGHINLTVALPEDLVDRARAAFSGTARYGDTFRDWIAEIVAGRVDELERDHNGGKPFPKAGQLPRGRRPGS